MNQNPTSKRCMLCRREQATEIGHIIPQFVYRYMIKTSPTGFMRGLDNPNCRMQDGRKYPFLCPTCEDKFSRDEKLFAQHFFHPVHEDLASTQPNHKIDYGAWLIRFCVSVSWRSLLDLIVIQHPGGILPHGDTPLSINALETWRQFLSGERNDISQFRQHMLILDEPTRMTGISNTKDLAIYFLRAVTHTTFHSSTDSYIFTKLCRIVIIGTIKDSVCGWKGTEVSVRDSSYNFDDKAVSGVLFRWLQEDILRMPSARENISPRQAAIIEAAVKKYYRRNI